MLYIDESAKFSLKRAAESAKSYFLLTND